MLVGSPPIDECVGWKEMAARRWGTMLILLDECFVQVDLSDAVCANLRNGYRDVRWSRKRRQEARGFSPGRNGAKIV
jgi:hypothetical protein